MGSDYLTSCCCCCCKYLTYIFILLKKLAIIGRYSVISAKNIFNYSKNYIIFISLLKDFVFFSKRFSDDLISFHATKSSVARSFARSRRFDPRASSFRAMQLRNRITQHHPTQLKPRNRVISFGRLNKYNTKNILIYASIFLFWIYYNYHLVITRISYITYYHISLYLYLSPGSVQI